VAEGEISVDSIAAGVFGVVLTTTADSPDFCPVLLDDDVVVGSGSTNRQRPSYMSIILTL
jgi:hypothetical protein